MNPDPQTAERANAAAEEILRVIYGEGLRGCAVNVGDIAAVIQTALDEQACDVHDVAELHRKAFEAVQLLATPPTDGQTLSAEDLRSLLGDRLDKIRELATKIVAATQPGDAQPDGNGSGATSPRG